MKMRTGISDLDGEVEGVVLARCSARAIAFKGIDSRGVRGGQVFISDDVDKDHESREGQVRSGPLAMLAP